MQPFHFEHAPIRYIICIIPPRVPPHFRPNTSGSSFKIQKMELSMATDLPLWTSDDCIKFVQQSMKNLDQKYQTMIWIELSAIWDPIMWLDPLWWNFQMKNGGSSFLWWDCEYISVRHLKKWLRLKKRLHFRSCIDEGFPNHQRSKQRNWLCIRESHLFFGKGNVLALPDDSVQHDVDPSIPLENGELLNKRNRSASSTVRQPAVPAGRRPLVGAWDQIDGMD